MFYARFLRSRYFKFTAILVIVAFTLPFNLVSALASSYQNNVYIAGGQSALDPATSDPVASTNPATNDARKKLSLDLPPEYFESRPGPSTEDLATAKEVPHKRGEAKKVYRTDAGYEILKLFSGPVNYLAEDNTYQAIDNTLIDSSDNKTIENKANKFKVKFKKLMVDKKSADKSLVEYKIADKKLGISAPVITSSNDPLSINGPQEIKGSYDITYPDLYEGIDLNYEVSNEQVKENVILSTYKPSLKISYDLDLQKGLTYKQNGNKIEFYDEASGQQLFSFLPTYLQDNYSSIERNLGKRSTDILTEIADTPDGTTLTYTLDDAFLSDSATIYPVNFDPTLVSQGQSTAKDARIINGDYSSQEYGTSPDLAVDNVGSPDAYDEQRTLLEFDLYDVPSLYQININDANIGMWLYDVSNDDGYDVNLHRNTSSWDELDVEWDEAPSYSSTITDSNFVADPPQYEEWNDSGTTNLVLDWLCNLEGGIVQNSGCSYSSRQNYGVTLKVDPDEIYDFARKSFYSKENSLDLSDKMPSLNIAYSNTNFGLGYEGFWSYDSKQLTDTLTSSVNLFDQNLVIQHMDTTVDGKLPIKFTHTFNSQTNNVGTYDLYYGNKSTISYANYLYKYSDSNSIHFKDDDGTVHIFRESSNGYISPTGKHLRLATGDQNNTIRDNSGFQYIFASFDANKLAKLLEVKDINGNSLNMSYSTEDVYKLTKVDDNVGNFVSLNYDSDTKRLIEVVDSAGKTVKATYDSSGYLKAFTDGYGTSEERTTSLDVVVVGAGSKLAITDPVNWASTDPSKKQTTYHVNGAGQVTQSNYADGTKISYTPGTGYLFDRLDKTTPLGTYRYKFTSYGQIASVDRPDNATENSIYEGVDPISHNNTLGNSEASTYYGTGNSASHTDFGGNTSKSLYDSDTDSDNANNLIESKSALDFQNFSVYDSKNNQISAYSGATYDYVLKGSYSTYDSAGNLISSFPDTAVNANYAEGGNFEVDTDANGVGDNWGSIMEAGTYSLSTIAKITSKSQKVVTTTSKNIVLSHVATIDTNRNYVFSAWVKTEGVVAGTGKGSGIGVKAGSNPVVLSSYLVGTNDWQKLYVRFNSGSATSVNLYLNQGYSTGTATGTTYFDGAQLLAYDNDWATGDADMLDSSFNMVSNAGFEYCSSGCGSTGVVLKNWQKYTGGQTIDHLTHNKNTATPEIEGNYYMETTRATSTAGQTYIYSSQDLIVKAQTPYILHGFLRAKNSGTFGLYFDGNAFAYIAWINSGGTQIGTSDIYKMDKRKNWHAFALYAPAPANAAKAVVYLGVDGKYVRAYFDGIRLEEGKNFAVSSYDANNLRKLKDIDHGGNETSYTYTSYGDISMVTNTLGSAVNFFYNSFRKLKGIALDQTGINIRASYDYDGNGNLSKITRISASGDRVSEYRYDELNRPTQETNSMGRVTTYTYFSSIDTHAGQLKTKTLPSGALVTYDYNNQNILDYTNYHKGTEDITADLSYDTEGNLSSYTVNGAYVNNSFNDNNTLTKVDDQSEGYLKRLATEYTYDDDMRMTSYLEDSYDNGNSSDFKRNFTYDSLGSTTYLEAGICNNCGSSLSTVFSNTTFGFDDKNNLVAFGSMNTANTYLAYSDDGALTSQVTIAKVNSQIMKESASYDALHNLTRQDMTYKNVSSTDNQRTYTYTYDAVNRLVSADIAGTSYGYSYDNTGNLTQRKKGATTDTFRYNIGDQLATYDINGATYYASYDLDGNMLSDGVYTYQYSAAGKISKITTSQDTITYENNYDGLRHGKTVGANTKIVFNYNKDNQLISERKSTTATPDTFYSWANDRVVSLTKYSSTGGTYDSYYLHADSTGNIINITNKNGAVVKTYEYDPYGNVIATTGTLDQPFQYKGAFGYYTDKETGLIYLQQRYYSLKLMRFMSADQSHNSIDRLSQKLKTPLELNPYIYSQDNPVNVMDEDGNHGKYFRNLGFTIPLLNVKSAFIYWENHGGCTWWDFHHSTDGAFGMRGDFRWHCHSWAAGVIFTAGGVIYNGYTWFYKGGVDQVPGHPESHFSKMYAVKQQYDAMWP